MIVRSLLRLDPTHRASSRTLFSRSLSRHLTNTSIHRRERIQIAQVIALDRPFTWRTFATQSATSELKSETSPPPTVLSRHDSKQKTADNNSKSVGSTTAEGSVTNQSAKKTNGGEVKKNKVEKASMMKRIAVKSKELTLATGRVIWQFIRNPLILKDWSKQAWVAIKHMAEHTWTGFKLLGVEVNTSSNLVRKRLAGHQLTRRERRQLVRTTADLARVVPFMFFILVPFMEFLLPVALKIFPNMLPSTFQDKYKEEENMKRQLKLRIELAGFLQEMVSEMENKAHAKSKQGDGDEPPITVEDVQSFMQKVRMGANIEDTTVLKVAKLFSDELTTDNMSRSQLVTLCKYMGLAPYGGDQFLRFQLRQKINSLREDDVSIFFEGVESLNVFELKQACQERGMRATGLTMHQLRTQLKRWIDLSVNKNVPLSLLILSRAFTLEAGEKSQVEHAISEAISQMDSDVLQEALVAGAESKDVTVDQATLSRLKLEAIRQQNELIQAEIKEKARKQAFLEQLRQKAQAELEAQEGENAGQVSLDAVRKTVEEKVERISVPLNAESLKDAVNIATDATKKKKKKQQTTTVSEPSPSGDAGKLSPLDEELKLEPNQPDMAQPLKVEESSQQDDEESHKEFTETLESIKVLASDSSLIEEKNILEEILEKQEELDAAKAVDSGRILKTSDYEDSTVAAESYVPEKGARSMLKKKVKSMLDKLEIDVEAIDEKIGNKFKLLDLDEDGKISAFELRQAIVTALKQQGRYTDEKADRLIARLDLDKDGIIDLEQLDAVLQSLKEQQIRIDGE